MKKIEYKEGDVVGPNGCVFIEDIPLSGTKRKALFKCGCGEKFISQITNVKNGNTKSCGCRNNERRITHNLYKHPLYRTWADMKSRCYTKHNDSYKYYRLREITVCNEWKDDFKAFYDYVISLPNYGKSGYSLDRENNDKGYYPGNVRWADKHTQSVNQKVRKDNKSGYSGVQSHQGKWMATINSKYISIHLTIEDAVNARNQYIIDNNLNEYKIQTYV